MPHTIHTPSLRIPIEPLTQTTFSSFGTVVENPLSPENALPSNQGSALKYVDISRLTNSYSLAPSRKPARAEMNMFVCKPRQLQHISSLSYSRGSPTKQMSVDNDGLSGTTHAEKALPDVKILERHPFTSQTFIPLGLAPADTSASYLVIVAPTLPASASRAQNARPPPFPQPEPRRRSSLLDVFSRGRPSPFTNLSSPPSSSPTASPSPQPPKGPGMPDLANIKAFVARGDQAVTYAAGTWHAPMVVLGAEDVAFVVVQFANGVGLEDCQEVELIGSDGLGISVVVEDGGTGVVNAVRAKL
ncbi:hypothetical protein B0A49_02212 [Cryomyces minteri]|uniref:Ureidoglycolate hydrolase n=1 Tax=Cryomyces minteri TaxID=331657 RepID=A0A4U0WET8_9PEZI|nr:hypothetical protein B0A49_05939 [Cryomyces minteri]TKA74377.1 hypothetical protein B0A49_02212 [Cryomyces minteri]